MRAFPAHFSRLQPRVEAIAPKLGEHARSLAAEVGIVDAALDDMFRAGGLAVVGHGA